VLSSGTVVSVRIPEGKMPRALEIIQSRIGPRRSCPACGGDRLDLNPEILEVRPYSKGTLVTGGAVMPLFAFSCPNCGFTRFHSAFVLGLVGQAGELTI
jgi:predicted RNA-binding Zn-ribbon protein involved in translation (DUF1610 family)